MGEVETDHGDRPLLIEHDVGGIGVHLDVELRHGAPVAHMHAATHEHDFLHTLDDARFESRRQRYVGKRAGGNQRDGAGLIAHDRVDDPVDGMAGIERTRRLRQFHAVKAGLAMDCRRNLRVADDRARTAWDLFLTRMRGSCALARALGRIRSTSTGSYAMHLFRCPYHRRNSDDALAVIRG